MTAKLRANLDALAVLNDCRGEARWATADEQTVLARWSGWGSVPAVFDPDDDRHADERTQLRRLLGTEEAWSQARRTTLNAHYTSADVAQAMWGAVSALGVDGDVSVLEPGCGSGNFLGFAPEGIRLTGVELDRTTGEIARHLYGARATIYTSGFEELRVEDGAFDLTIGNVPFAKVTPHDPVHNRGRHALHNYFLIKSLHLTRPGGLVVALTSRYTLDARNAAARREMASMADLVGAIRLPERAFARSSGTDVVVDMVILRRRPPGVEASGPAWESVGADAAPLEVNEYYLAHPEHVLGDLSATRGMYRDHELTVTPTGDLDEQLPVALADLAAGATKHGLTYVTTSRDARASRPERRAAPGDFYLDHAQDGSFVINQRGDVAQLQGGTPVTYKPRVAKDKAELVRLVSLRDAARRVLEVQIDGGSDERLDAAQHVLGELYRTYVRVYGPI
ncbi:MAG: helicase, partial [Mycobacterium sp.]